MIKHTISLDEFVFRRICFCQTIQMVQTVEFKVVKWTALFLTEVMPCIYRLMLFYYQSHIHTFCFWYRQLCNAQAWAMSSIWFYFSNPSSYSWQLGSDLWFSVFTALHGMQTRSSDENSVCPSVCLSVRHTRGLWQNGRKICPDLYTIWKNI